MKKLLVFLAVLFVSVMSSACINNFAIQELNIKAKEYLDKGDFDEAIKRLESSVDLDGSVFETRYNLSVAYVNKEEFQKAINQLNEAIKLNPSNADAYYTLGIAYEGEANKKVLNENIDFDKETPSEEDKNSENFASGLFANKQDAEYSASMLENAIKSYEKYLELTKIPEDFEKVQEHINELNEDKEKYLNEAQTSTEIPAGE